MRTFARLGAPAVTTVVGIALASPAFAHVSVQPEGTAAKGGYATVNVKVPNERPEASTVKVEVSFPAAQPLASVMPQALPGWKVEVTQRKLDKPLTLHGKSITEAVSKVTWTATGKGIEPGYFQKFPLSLGQLPEDADELVLKALQRYSNKEVVRWIEPPVKGQEEPEHPAAVLKLAAATDDHHGAPADSTSPSAEPEAKPSAAGDDHDSESAAAGAHDGGHTTERLLGIAGIVLGIGGIVTAIVTRRRSHA
ncbi:YcnI family protein [Streptomyces sp. RB110-1]|uniref:YcnI family copper-binding membrane protein n=1 Tax=unclassified Streptomyces TaxID=2593676 RepID=UPI0018FFD402|nr:MULTISPECIES: YcnI family protein [unclassified Streptomyces]MBK0372965.1 YcnI family protein [Streptomyces sp. RB110-1]MBK0390667.1 YcnI family protein [Streptomyces sp. RB110-2]